MDAMLQIELIARPDISFGLPTKITYLSIDPGLHIKSVWEVNNMEGNKDLLVKLICHGVLSVQCFC